MSAPRAELPIFPGSLPAHRLPLAQLSQLRGGQTARDLRVIRDVVLIASSSRGGSSMVAETLRHSSDVLSFSAEVNPFFRMVGLGFPDSGTGSDRLDAADLDRLDPVARTTLEEELALDIGCAAGQAEASEFVADVAWRLVVQWPELSLDPQLCMDLTLQVLRRLSGTARPVAGHLPPTTLILTELLAELRRRGVPVSSKFYDLGPGRTLDQPSRASNAAPGDMLLEEPPFVVPRPWCRPRPDELACKPLIIKTPSNVYRIRLLRALFPNARFRLIHLTRNPAAAINGLYDGWRSDWFHAHRMAEPLRIRGYTDEYPAAARWWKFDLPPGWQEYTEADLLQICAFQWRSAHLAILSEIDRGETEYLPVRFEDILSGPQCRVMSFRRVADWLGIPFLGRFRQVVEQGIPAVVTTAPPRAGRWLSRADRIRQAIDDQVLDVAERMGYGDADGWILCIRHPGRRRLAAADQRPPG